MALQGNFLNVYIRTTLIDCTINVPGLSMPIGLAKDNLPIGIMIQGKPGVPYPSSALLRHCEASHKHLAVWLAASFVLHHEALLWHVDSTQEM